MRLFEGTEFDIPPKCDRCGSLESECKCPPVEEPKKWLAPEKQMAVVRKEKRKKGKMVTVVSGLCADGNDLATLLTTLKNACGAGGTVKNSNVEIQGVHIENVASVLKNLGYKVKDCG